MGKSKYKIQNFYDIQIAESEVAMAGRNFWDVITLSTRALDKLMETHTLKLLGLRATAYENKGLLSRALEDATRMTQYVPGSSAGYLKTGCILMSHGKPHLAVDNYKEGLKIVSMLDSQYSDMQKEHDKAVSRAQLRIDIVGKLPRELVHKVLTNLDPERVWVCLSVSKRWCEQVSKCGNWWSSVTVKQTDTEIDQVLCNAIPLVKEYIQQLELANLSSADLNKKYLTHIKCGIFTNLKVLSLKGSFFQNMVSEDLAIALWLVRGTLASLEIDFGSGNSFPLLLVLGSCPNIEKLCYTTQSPISLWNPNSGYASGCKKLSNLELSYSEISYSVLCEHLKICPSLRRLVLKSSSMESLGDPNGTTFTDHCPKLKILGLGCTEGLPEFDGCDRSDDKKGVAYMAVYFNCHFIWCQTAKHINSQLHSLRQLNIVQRKHTSQYYSANTTSPIICSKLSTLRLTYYDNSNDSYYRQYHDHTSEIQKYVGNIIQNSPHLVDLSLFGGPYVSTYIRTPLEQAVKSKTQVLTLNSVSFQNTNADWYNNFFSSLNQVHTLVLQGISLSEGKLCSLAASNSVQELSIIDCAEVTDKMLSAFFKTVAACQSHHITTLNLSKIPISMSVTAIRFLIKINSLVTLKITNCTHFTAESVNKLIACAPGSSLKTIEILDCFSPDVAPTWLDAVKRLEKKGVTLRIK